MRRTSVSSMALVADADLVSKSYFTRYILLSVKSNNLCVCMCCVCV